MARQDSRCIGSTVPNTWKLAGSGKWPDQVSLSFTETGPLILVTCSLRLPGKGGNVSALQSVVELVMRARGPEFPEEIWKATDEGVLLEWTISCGVTIRELWSSVGNHMAGMINWSQVFQDVSTGVVKPNAALNRTFLSNVDLPGTGLN